VKTGTASATHASAILLWRYGMWWKRKALPVLLLLKSLLWRSLAVSKKGTTSAVDANRVLLQIDCAARLLRQWESLCAV